MDVFSIFRVAERMSILLVLPSAYWDLSLTTLFKRLATRHGINYRTSVFQSLKTCLSVCGWSQAAACVALTSCVVEEWRPCCDIFKDCPTVCVPQLTTSVHANV